MRFELIDAIRAIAALMVLAYHLGLFSGLHEKGLLGKLTLQLNVGVAIFFAVSGFVMYRPFLVGRSRSITRYVYSRLLRIIPAYWFVLTLAALNPKSPEFIRRALGSEWWRYYLFAQIYDPTTVGNGLAVAWSLCVEMTFYALLPIYAFLLDRLAAPLGRRRFVAELVVLTVASVAGLVAQRWTVTYTIVGTFCWFAPGMVLAAASVTDNEGSGPLRSVQFLKRHSVISWSGAAVCYIILATALGLSRDPDAPRSYAQFLWTSVLSALIGGLVLAPAVFASESCVIRRFLSLRWLSWLGLVSFGIYLWQLPVFEWVYALVWHPGAGHIVSLACAILGVLSTIAVAGATYYAVERPALRLKERLRSMRC